MVVFQPRVSIAILHPACDPNPESMWQDYETFMGLHKDIAAYMTQPETRKWDLEKIWDPEKFQGTTG